MGAEHPLIDRVYAELRALAQHQLRHENPGAAIDATSLVHEAYVRLANRSPSHWMDERHFFIVAAQAIRRILIDHARRRRVADRAIGKLADQTASLVTGPDGRQADLLDLDAVLCELAELSERQARIVELRYFGGLTVDEVADCLGCAPRTVDADWRMAKRWLRQRLVGRSTA